MSVWRAQRQYNLRRRGAGSARQPDDNAHRCPVSGLARLPRTVRGRLGYLVTPTLLLYGTAGLAYAGVNFSAAYATLDLANVYGAAFNSPSYSDTRVGWTAGAGVEWMFMPNWSAKVEYLYYDLGSATLNAVITGTNNLTGATGYGYATSTSARFNGNLVRAGVSYHFSWATPTAVLAKY